MTLDKCTVHMYIKPIAANNRDKIMDTSTLTSSELTTFRILVSLGDSEQLAFDTVMSKREKEDSTAEYQAAYYS